MNSETHAARLPITTIVARTSCPICAALKEFQNDLVKHLGPEECRHFCNAHAWLVAKSAPAESVATILLKAIANPEWRPAAPVPDQCDVCKKMNEEKELRLHEIAEQLRQPKLRSWLQEYGILCLRHGRDVMAKVPADLQGSIQELMARNSREMVETLERFLKGTETGSHVGGGVLGRAAEFLVAQRGI